ncbi:tetrachloroethene dehalogenase [Dehalobacter sp. TBBPA1]|uniref:tetrachloroethene dehalogenase n=1 Tax=Dehalobacter sp. TBBPA1 TaxID=3235037 RepID=UPI0034A3C0EF
MIISNVIIWMSLGIIFVLIQYGIWWYLKGKGKATIPLQLCGFLANFFLLFSVAWGYQSFLEHEYQAIAMGFMFFGGTALIPAIITYRLANRGEKAKKEKADAISA